MSRQPKMPTCYRVDFGFLVDVETGQDVREAIRLAYEKCLRAKPVFIKGRGATKKDLADSSGEGR